MTEETRRDEEESGQDFTAHSADGALINEIVDDPTRTESDAAEAPLPTAETTVLDDAPAAEDTQAVATGSDEAGADEARADEARADEAGAAGAGTAPETGSHDTQSAKTESDQTAADRTQPMAEIDEENLHEPDEVQPEPAAPPRQPQPHEPIEADELRQAEAETHPEEAAVAPESKLGPLTPSMWVLSIAVFTFVISFFTWLAAL